MPESADNAADTSPLREEILADAAKRADRARRRAKKDADALLAEARTKADAIAAEMLAEAEADAVSRTRVELATVPLEEKRMDLLAREAVIAGIFDEALARLGERGDDADTIARLALAAAGKMSRTTLVLRVAPRDAALLDDAFLARLAGAAPKGTSFTRGEPLADGAGGVLVVTEDGREMFDNTFETRLRRLRERLREEVAARLWRAEKSEANE